MAQKLGSALVTRLFVLILLITFTLGDKALEQRLDSGRSLPLIFTGEKGGTYKCMQTSIMFMIQGHINIMTLIEVRGPHIMQEVYESLHAHNLGQSVTVFVTLRAHQPAKDCFIVASSPFKKSVLTATAILHYSGSKISPSKPLPIGPAYHIHCSQKRARTIGLSSIANAVRPNPQGSFHYGTIPIVRILVLENTAVETKPCTYKKFPAKAEPFPAETKPRSHVVNVLPRNRRLLGKLTDVNVHSPPSTSNEKSWSLDKIDPPSPPAPSANRPIAWCSH